MSAQTTILDRFYQHAKDRPDDVYLTQPIGGGRVDDFSFARCLDEARRMATYLKSLGFPPGSNIAIATKNCAHFFLSDLAIWMAGHVSVALYPTLTHDTVRYILNHSEAKLLFVGKLDTWADIQKGVPEGLPCVAYPLAPANSLPKWDEIIKQHEPLPDPPLRAPDDHALIIYTSGSTGQPKGVLHSFRTISNPTERLVDFLGVRPSDRSLSYLPLAHAMDRWVSECLSMWVGSRIFFAEALDTFVEDLKRARPTLFISVPRLWLKFQLGVFSKMPEKKLNRMLKIPILSGIVKKKILKNLGLSEVRFAGSGSAPIPAELIGWYRNLGLELLEGYGMSENFNFSHLTKPGQGRAGYIGHPQAGVECKLSEQGEILVKSPGTMLGYYKEAELTKECFTEDGFLKTGDRGEIDAEGRLKITGRIKELFKTSKGKYVAPMPIENLINANSNVELSLVAGNAMPATHAVLQVAEQLLPKLADPAVRAELEASLEKLLAEVNAQLPDYERLDFLVVTTDRWSPESGDLTPTLKIKRSVLEAKYQPHWEAWHAAKKKVIWHS